MMKLMISYLLWRRNRTKNIELTQKDVNPKWMFHLDYLSLPKYMYRFFNRMFSWIFTTFNNFAKIRYDASFLSWWFGMLFIGEQGYLKRIHFDVNKIYWNNCFSTNKLRMMISVNNHISVSLGIHSVFI